MEKEIKKELKNYKKLFEQILNHVQNDKRLKFIQIPNQVWNDGR